MPTLALFSDLHLEHGGSFNFDLTDVDVCVLAGDIDAGGHTTASLELIATDYDECDFIFVPGNHEYYMAPHRVMLQHDWRTAATRVPNLHVLDGDVVELHGQRFVGATLWYHPYVPRGWSDFMCIKGLSEWLPYAHNEGVKCFTDNLQSGDIAVSHMLPSDLCVAPFWQGSDANCYFVTPMDPVIEALQPKYWLHGHTHSTVAVDIHKTKAYCNPHGYAHAPNPYFDRNFRLEF